MNLYKSIIIILSLIVAVFIGSLLVVFVRADEPIETSEPTTTTCATNEPITSDEPIEPTITSATSEPPTIKECEPITSDEPLTHEAIIERDTGLHVDYIQLIDEYTKGNWCALYVHCDGDLYVITIKNNCVDVCCILN